MKLRIADMVNDSIVDGPGLRLTVFVQGCPHGCKGCHNPETHSTSGGRLIDSEEIMEIVKKNTLLDGITFSGGEPFMQSEALAALAKQIKSLGLNVITYTGFLFEDLIKDEKKRLLLEASDYIIDGRFEEDKKSLALVFRGSSNQRIIDVKKTLSTGILTKTDFKEDF